MNSRVVVAALAAASSLGAQSFERRASMRGGGNPYNGKCTIEVVVDGSAEVEIRGDRAFLRNLDGRPPEWRRFECNGMMSSNPGDFRFQGIDGRGRQTLLRDPRRNQGTVVVLLEDPANGAEGYTFDILWNADGRRGVDADGPFRDSGSSTGRVRADRRNAGLFEETRVDLGRASSSLGLRGDESRLDKVFEQLNELERDYSRGRLNYRQMDDVIDTLRRVLRDNRLNPRDRDNLTDDLNRLQDLRGRR